MKVMHLFFLSLFLIENINAQCTDMTNKYDCKTQSCHWIAKQSKCIPPPSPCLHGNDKLDIVILVDASCPITVNQCKQQQNDIVNVIKSIKIEQQIDTSHQVFENMQIGYIEFGSTQVNSIFNLHDKPTPFNKIIDSSICNGNTITYINQRQRNPLLKDAISTAIGLFSDQPRDEKILIFSNCGVTNEVKTQICTDYENNNDVEFIMVNNNADTASMSDPETYMMCLAEYDTNRIITPETFNDDIIHNIHQELCEFPTPIPTVDPTILPTQQIHSTKTTTIVSESTTRITTQEPIITTTTQAHTTGNPSASPTIIITSLPTQSPSITSNPLTVIPTTST
eukprot:359172_1